MNNPPLKYLSESRLNQLIENIPENRDLYRNGNFIKQSEENGWAIESSLTTIDTSALSTLDGSVQDSNDRIRTADADAKNSIIVYEALKGMTPALAMEERVWVRLAHLECIEYTRSRWFYRSHKFDDAAFDKHVRLHFFAGSLTGIRDDNALSRLWWNMYIATLLSPSSPKEALSLILKNADTRSNLVERSWTGARLPLSRGILRMIEREPWLTAHQQNFRDFMKFLNRDGGGILLEGFPENERNAVVDSILENCVQKAKAH